MVSGSGPHTPRLGWTSLFHFAWFALCLVVAGCQGGAGQAVSRWTLDVPGAEPQPIQLPAHLTRELPERVLKYRLQTSVRLDPRLVGREVELVLVYLPAFVSLRVNGETTRLQGEPGPDNEFGGHLPRRWLLPTSATERDQPVRLELEVTHTWTRSALLDAVPELVLAGTPVPAADRNRLLNVQGGWFGMIGLCQVGMTFLVVYFCDRRRRAYLWFAIQALTAAYYPAYVLGLTGPLLGWPLQNVLLAQSLAVAPIVAVYFAHSFFGLPPPHRFWLVLLGVALLSPLTVALRDYHFHDLSYATGVVVMCVAAALAYQLVVGVRLLRSYPDRRTVILFLCCWIALGAASWPDLLAWLGYDLLLGGRSGCLGLGLFSIFQSMLLGRSHFRSLAEADGLNDTLRGQVRTLEERQAEIATLNEELRRQIGRRSEDILDALTASSAVPQADLAPGHVVEARYRILGTLGKGGMGTVYQVERLSDHKHLALKLSREVRGMALARLAREAQIAARVHHPNVVSIVDADVAQGGHAYLVMEFVEGRTLAECEEQRPYAWCLEVLSQVLEGVQALHAQGVIHRDLKPNNILLSDAEGAHPRVKITDFGISRWFDSEPTPLADDVASETQRVHAETPATVQARAPSARPGKSLPSLTQTGAITGTPLYVAPELANKAASFSPAVDVFSFGVVAYRLLTGKPPHVEAPLHARLAGREIAPVLPAIWVSRHVSEPLSHMLDACLSAEPAERPEVSTMLALLQVELERWRDRSARVATHG
jgi:serine/threonine protein kinase